MHICSSRCVRTFSRTQQWTISTTPFPTIWSQRRTIAAPPSAILPLNAAEIFQRIIEHKFHIMPAQLDQVSYAAIAAAIVVALALLRIFKFIKANADMKLLSKPPLSSNAFRNKVVWVVGASQGLGEELALQWAQAGARLIVSSRTLGKLQVVKKICSQHISSENIVCLPLDLTGPPEKLEEAANAAFAAFDGAGIDYVIHNAGASQHAAAEETSNEVSQSIINLNLMGPIALTRATLPLMLQRGTGRHVVISSMSAVVPSPGQATYAAAKSGLKSYFLSVASELAGSGVGVTVCCPGPLATGFDGKPRIVFGSNGFIEQASTGMSKSRVPVRTAAALILKAAYHGLDECWIAYHPVLLIGYVMQYMPVVGMAVLKRIGPGRVRQLRDGSGSGYEVVGMLKKQSS